MEDLFETIETRICALLLLCFVTYRIVASSEILIHWVFLGYRISSSKTHEYYFFHGLSFKGYSTLVAGIIRGRILFEEIYGMHCAKGL